MSFRFADRRDAGRQLGRALAEHKGRGALVLGIPRGGVEVAAEVARALQADLDVVVARKLGTPGQAELAMGAVTPDGATYLNREISRFISPDQIARVQQRETAEARRREQVFRAGRAPLEVKGRVVILVDDGLATGATMLAAVACLARQKPARLIAAVPVGAPSTCQVLRQQVDELICLHSPTCFQAVGLFYDDFCQVDDYEVLRILAESSPTQAETRA